MCHNIIMEEKIIIWLQSLSNNFYDVFFQSISYLASWIGAIFVFLIVLLFLDKKYALFMGVGYSLTVLFNYILKIIVARPRPYVTNPEIINKLTTIGQSFPSGHSMSVVFIVLALLYLFSLLCKKGKFEIYKKTWFKIICYTIGILLVILTGISRMYLGQHYITDILAGYIVGALGFVGTYLLYRYQIKNKTNKSKD